MKFLAPIMVLAAVLFQLTAPDGSFVWFSPSEIVAISSPATCTNAGSRVMTTMGSFCVRESVELAVKKFKDAQ